MFLCEHDNKLNVVFRYIGMMEMSRQNMNIPVSINLTIKFCIVGEISKVQALECPKGDSTPDPVYEVISKLRLLAQY